jgi:hypothetical protein
VARRHRAKHQRRPRRLIARLSDTQRTRRFQHSRQERLGTGGNPVAEARQAEQERIHAEPRLRGGFRFGRFGILDRFGERVVRLVPVTSGNSLGNVAMLDVGKHRASQLPQPFLVCG